VTNGMSQVNAIVHSFVCLMGCNSLHSCTILVININLSEMYLCGILPFICAFALVIQPILGYDRALYDSGSTVYLEITFHEFDRLYFVDQRDVMLGNIQEATVGAQDPIGYRDMETSPNTAGPLGYQARLLFDFAKRDSTPASLLASTLRNSPEDVFPPSEVSIVILIHLLAGMVLYECGRSQPLNVSTVRLLQSYLRRYDQLHLSMWNSWNEGSSHFTNRQNGGWMYLSM
jgi:hypothetical protein